MSTRKNKAAVALGKRGGVKVSAAKTAAARENAKKPRPNAKLRASAPALLEKLKRAQYLMSVVARYMEENPIACEYIIHYDDADCDGGCIGQDCASHAEDALSLITELEATQ